MNPFVYFTFNESNRARTDFNGGRKTILVDEVIDPSFTVSSSMQNLW
ncbi:hypothetical protein ECEC1737_3662 [Escherichia coli EC1737]|nr:hypothetical protein ECH7EC4401_0349 [Escherichia coli O157:H7 str. EC4401]EIN40291.1 hypothetical protein ECFRIK1990_3888 [Escherichia coli FRIK1990]EIN69837.1 hypothetical protein ECPA10_4022 [Escherichia coli PA10]EIO35121.1 hypothetical protein ECPA41_3821 [Escherichia coli PA41]EIP54535.1 hypothetical protein ECEC4448_3757 [Escherichia coli EC4448]EKH35794.1 hypothetical protein ECFRIK1997_3987 [Escherichia coli FRIK1997]EKI64322.1 hypothetical protein ECEC1737_3662 [Escherichia coli 